jgi:ribonuclease D
LNVDLVSEPAALTALCERIAAAPRIALDTEFHTEKHFTPKLMVVQVAFDDAVAIVDPLALPDLRPLADALTGATVVGHALSSDLRILEDAFQTLPRDAYDTQVAAAFCGYGMSISLLDLVRDVAGVTLLKSQTVSDWSTRPFTPRQVDYLVDDVRYLFAVADKLNEKLVARGRLSWALEEMRTLVDARTYRSDKRRLYLRVAGNARMNRRELGVLNELALLRESIARERNIPLKYVLPDDVLVGLVGLRPATVEELGQLRRLDAGMRKHIGTRIISAVAAGEAIPEDALPPRAPRPLGAQRDALVAAMALLINAVAAANDLPAALLVSRVEIERIARDLPQSPEELAELLALTPWRRDLVVGPLWEFLSGERVLRISGYRDGLPKTTWETRLEESLASE